MGFVAFMRSPIGRALRITAGAALLYVGFGLMRTSYGTLVAMVGLVPLAAGIFNVCLFAPLFGLDMWGKPKPRLN